MPRSIPTVPDLVEEDWQEPPIFSGEKQGLLDNSSRGILD